MKALPVCTELLLRVSCTIETSLKEKRRAIRGVCHIINERTWGPNSSYVSSVFWLVSSSSAFAFVFFFTFFFGAWSEPWSIRHNRLTY